MDGTRIVDYFAGGNTARGFFSLFEYLPQGAVQVYIIKGGPGTGKSTLMRGLGHRLVGEGYGVEFHHCSSDPDSLDGMLCGGVGVAIMDGTAPHTREAVRPGIRDEIVNLGRFWDRKRLWGERERIETEWGKVSEHFASAYRYLENAGQVHEHLRSDVKKKRDPERIRDAARRCAGEFLEDWWPEPGPTSCVRERHLFAGAITPEGIVSYHGEIAGRARMRYLLTGPPGCGKTLFMKELWKQARKRGVSATIFHCALEPRTLDLLVLHGVNCAVINSIEPHAVDDVREGDRKIDLAALSGLGVGTRAAGAGGELGDIADRLIRGGIRALARARRAHDRLEEYYIRAMDFGGNERLEDELFARIMHTADYAGCGNPGD